MRVSVVHSLFRPGGRKVGGSAAQCSLNRGFGNRGFRNRGNVPWARAKTCVWGSLSQGCRIPVKHLSGHAKQANEFSKFQGERGTFA